MARLHPYLPQDRLRALARGATLPDRTHGAVLFADISGFTPLTERLRQALGPRRGAEELTHHLDAVYTALIAAVEHQGGSVIGFSGDAITCWFDDEELGGLAVPRALACALALQAAMHPFTELALKVTLASGPARRFVVGDPQIHYMDTLAGATVARTATAEHLAHPGEVLVDEATVHALGTALSVSAWRTAEASGERFGVVAQFVGIIAPPDLPTPTDVCTDDALQAWVPHAIFARESSGQGSFLTEFRPCAVLFVRFTGIDYDDADAQHKLDAFIQHLQATATRYDGALLNLTIGDKGSYACVVFGALSAHEDDARRAVKTALALHASALLQLQIGITYGTLRVGAYGGPTRRTYSAIGDDVNLAARLMQAAAPGACLINEAMYKALGTQFTFERRPTLTLKGKAEPVSVFAVTGARAHRAVRLQEPSYALPMVGRQAELERISALLELTLTGRAQLIGIVAEAGMGKSRLVAEVIRAAHQRGFVGYGGACQSDGVHTPYLAWKAIWAAFFDVDPTLPVPQQISLLECELATRAPERLQSLPLLDVVLNVAIPDNEFTQSLEPRFRLCGLHVLLGDCLRAAAQDAPILIVIEDMHWIDALAHDLLVELTRMLDDSRVCFVLAYRPPELMRRETSRLEALANFTKIPLSELNAHEAEQALHAKLAQLYPTDSDALPAAWVEQLTARAQGNPFYLEELLNYLRDRGRDPRQRADLETLELPESLHALILSRIDYLTETEKTTLRVASIIGRLFRAHWLTGYYPDLGSAPHVYSDLTQLAALDITPLESPAPELAYLFKHLITHAVTYESLPFATRARLHEQLAAYLEASVEPQNLASLLDTIAYHYGQSANTLKQRMYFAQAAQAALKVNAYASASAYLTRLLALTPDDDPTRSARALQLALAHKGLGDYPAARAAAQTALDAATAISDRVTALALQVQLASALGEYTAGDTLLAEAVPLARTSGDALLLYEALSAATAINWRLGQVEALRAASEECLMLARALADDQRETSALVTLGMFFTMQGDFDQATRLFTEVYTRSIAAGRWANALYALNNLGSVLVDRHDYTAAQTHLQQALKLARELGTQDMIAITYSNLAHVHIKLDQLTTARTHLHAGLELACRLGVPPLIVADVLYFSFLAHASGDTARALALIGLARQQPAWNGDSQGELERELAQWALDPAEIEAGLAQGAALDWDTTLHALLHA